MNRLTPAELAELEASFDAIQRGRYERNPFTLFERFVKWCAARPKKKAPE